MLSTAKKVSLKNNPDITETMIQDYIINNPGILELEDDIIPITKEKIQPTGGRIDLLLSSGDKETRYEVEIQLGATDPSHIIRTIEYWDNEKKMSPQYDHCAVIVAEEITGRFMNVISLFNGAIPLIAIQLNAYDEGNGNISLSCNKVLDRITYDIDSDVEFEATDRNYWEQKTSNNLLSIVDKIFNSLDDYTKGYDLKYNKHYIGISKNGQTQNFISFTPKKKFVYFTARGDENKNLLDKFDASGLEIKYNRWKYYEVKIYSLEDFNNNIELFKELTKLSYDYYKS